MENRPAIALWKRPDGSRCLLRKRDGEWLLTIEKDGELQRTLTVPSPVEGIRTANEWRDGADSEVA